MNGLILAGALVVSGWASAYEYGVMDATVSHRMEHGYWFTPPPRDWYTAVGHPRNGRTRNRLTLVARHAALTWNGVTVEDVVEVVSSTGETMFFGRGYGLVAWASMWGSSAIAQLLPANEADNEPEHGCFEAWR